MEMVENDGNHHLQGTLKFHISLVVILPNGLASYLTASRVSEIRQSGQYG